MVAYRALARKYRSRHFGELVGQDVLVRTLSNAIENNRIHHAYLFTGIRGTGKTSTARILAKAINYAGPSGDAGPTTGPTDDCPICQAIGEDRHPDVIEIDAASNTGVDDVRQIIENVRYAPVQARYKVFIIDEVHMLSKQAFNALLKTLEEPPPHVGFMLATTEIRKVPVTILSRCQRFDLRRIEPDILGTHYKKIAHAEQIIIDDEALEIIARAADGSARDGLSIFDQAIAQNAGAAITADALRTMMGQADRGAVIELLKTILEGNSAAALQKLKELHQAGSDPALILEDLLESLNLVTRVKIVSTAGDDITLSPHIRESAKSLAVSMPISSLSRLWQMMLKVIPELAQAPQPMQALEMALVRLCFASQLPPLDELIKRGQSPETSVVSSSPPPVSSPINAPVAQMRVVASQAAPIHEPSPHPAAHTIFADLPALVALCDAHNEHMLGADLYANVRVVKFTQGQIELMILPGAAKDLVSQLQKKLYEWTDQRWIVAVTAQATQGTLREQEVARKQLMIADAYEDANIKKLRTILPNLTVTDIITSET